MEVLEYCALHSSLVPPWLGIGLFQLGGSITSASMERNLVRLQSTVGDMHISSPLGFFVNGACDQI